MLVGKITGIENEESNTNQESSSVEEIICKVNRTCSIAYEEAQNTLINNPKSDELYEKVCVYLENIKNKIDNIAKRSGRNSTRGFWQTAQITLT